MKDTIVEAIHRHRAEHARRCNYDVHAIGEDIRRREAQIDGRLAVSGATSERFVEIKKPTVLGREKALASK